VSRNTFEEIKQIVFARRVGNCLSSAEWQKLYTEGDKALPVDHLTSCSQCLDIVNNLLGLPSLSERHPFDAINRDSDQDGPFNSTGSSGQPPKQKQSPTDRSILKKRLEEARQKQFGYRPQEITICVNGWPLVSRRIQSESNTLTVRPQVDEPLESLELLDEKGGLLFHLLIDEECASGNDRDWPNLVLNQFQKVTVSVAWIDDYPEINLEYSDQRVAQPQIAAGGLFEKLSLSWKQLFSMRRLMVATTAAILLLTLGLGLLMADLSRSRTIASLKRELESSRLEREDLARRLAEEQASRRQAEAERARIAKDLEQRPTPIKPETGQEQTQKLAANQSPLTLRLLQGTDDSSTTLLYNTRALIAPIALPRGERTRLKMRLPRYDDTQILFESYQLILSVPGRAPIVTRIPAPASSTDPLFFILEAVIGNTSKLAPKTSAQAQILGIIGQSQVELGRVPLTFE
jgi:hypothetical protein